MLKASRFQRDRVARTLERTDARGDQRERDRQRAQARKPVVKGRDDELTPEQRRERDAKALQEKAARKAAQAAGQGGNGAKGKVAGKK
uniref:Small EDRK-rich factor-like N-terminal domain-containing protein n=1 Tax=Leersia perrieri TaxID=77586 RepID=A0A0D9WGD9_9ORYZ